MTGLAAAAGRSGPALALEGGKPVREKPLRADHWGPMNYDGKELAQVEEVVRTGNPFRWYGRPGTPAPMKAAAFEQEFAARMRTRFALAVSSGTAALQTAMAAFGVGPGDEVILPAWTWHSDCTAVIMAGALPVFAEIDESFNIDPNDIEHRITPQTKLIVAIHLQGVPADLGPVLEIARKHRIPVLEDAAQSVGGSYRGQPLGSLGAMGIYSHQVNKTISSGEGGSVVTSDPVLWERAVRFHDVGGLRPFQEQALGQPKFDRFAGVNFRMTEFCGGVMLEQIRKLDSILGRARETAARIKAGVQDLPGIKLRKEPDPEGCTGDSIYLEFASKRQRDQFMRAMEAENVPARPPAGSVILPVQPYIEKKLTAHPNWPTWTVGRGRTVRYGAHTCPRTIDIHARFAGVSIDPGFTKRDADDVVAAIRKVYPAVTAT
jgi:8-amino-3,8-dideoxy-alpha-D-manno-octulosonate transaminase